MGFKAYLMEGWPLVHDHGERALFKVDNIYQLDNTTIYMNWFRDHYNASTLVGYGPYSYDSIHLIDIERKVFPIQDASITDSIALKFACSVYLPEDIQTLLPAYLRGEVPQSNISRVWSHTFVNEPHGLTAIWAERGDTIRGTTDSNTQTIYCLYVPAAYSYDWELFKWLYRSVFFAGVSLLAWRTYYYHIFLLIRLLKVHPITVNASKDIVRYEIILGDPAPLLVTHPIVCIWMIWDNWIVPEHLGQACQRIAQTDNLWYLFVGSMYVSRCVWFAYGGLTLTNWILKRLKKPNMFVSLSTTMIEIASFIYGEILSHSIVRWPPLLKLFQVLSGVGIPRNNRGECDRIEAKWTVLLYSIALVIFPLVLAMPKLMSKISLRIRDSSHLIETYTEVTSSENIKHRLVLWSIGLNNAKLKHIVCSGGSLHRLLQIEPLFRSQYMINQQGTDCYVVCYGLNGQILSLHRLSLITQIDFSAAGNQLQVENINSSVTGSVDICRRQPNRSGRVIVNYNRVVGIIAQGLSAWAG